MLSLLFRVTSIGGGFELAKYINDHVLNSSLQTILIHVKNNYILITLISLLKL